MWAAKESINSKAFRIRSMVYRYRTHIRAHILETIIDRVQHIDKRLVRDGKRWIVQPLGYALGLGEVFQPLLDLLARVAEARLILQQTFAGLMQRGRFLRHKVKLLGQLAERIERYVDLLHHLVAFAGARSELLVVLQVHIVKVFENFGIECEFTDSHRCAQETLSNIRKLLWKW